MRVYLNKKPSEKYSIHIFVSKLVDVFRKNGVKCVFDKNDKWDVCLALIEMNDPDVYKKGPVVQRLDGIYFNSDDSETDIKNKNIIKTYGKSKGVVFQSNLAKEIITKNFGKPPKKNTVIHNGTIIERDLTKEGFSEEFPKIANRLFSFNKRIISTAKWRQIKRPESVVEGSIEYIRNNKDTCLLLIGECDSNYYLDKYPEFSNNLIFTGKIENKLVRYLQVFSDVCLNLSFTDSQPNNSIESLAHGTPVVTTKFQGTVDIMKDNSGVILDVDKWDLGRISYNNDIKKIDPVIVAEAIDKCIKIGKGSFREDLSIDYVAKKYMEFLRQCI